MILALHFHLGVLILADTLEAVQHKTTALKLPINIAMCRLSSTRAIVNLINLMLLQDESFTGPDNARLIHKDPYPEHTRNTLTRAAYSVLKLYNAMSLLKQTAEIMASTLFSGLDALAPFSYAPDGSLEKLHSAYGETDLEIRRRRVGGPSASQEATDAPDIFEEETVKQLGLAEDDPSLIDKSIERHETREYANDSTTWDDLPEIDFSSISQDWTFEVIPSHSPKLLDTELTQAAKGLFFRRLKYAICIHGKLT